MFGLGLWSLFVPPSVFAAVFTGLSVQIAFPPDLDHRVCIFIADVESLVQNDRSRTILVFIS